MNEVQRRQTIDYACRMVNATENERHALSLHVSGLHPKLIAGELGITENAVRIRLHRGWRRIIRRHWTLVDANQIVEAGEAAIRGMAPQKWDTQGGTELHHVELLRAARNSRRYTAPTPTYDANGRQVGVRDPLVSPDDVLRFLRGWDELPRLF